ncbi:hypothetical protein ACIXMS_01150 [Bacteroides fragilis]
MEGSIMTLSSVFCERSCSVQLSGGGIIYDIIVPFSGSGIFATLLYPEDIVTEEGAGHCGAAFFAMGFGDKMHTYAIPPKSLFPKRDLLNPT